MRLQTTKLFFLVNVFFYKIDWLIWVWSWVLSQAETIITRVLVVPLFLDVGHTFNYRKVASSRPVYYSILELLGQRSQHGSNFPFISLLKILGCTINRDSLLLATLHYRQSERRVPDWMRRIYFTLPAFWPICDVFIVIFCSVLCYISVREKNILISQLRLLTNWLSSHIEFK